MSGTTSNAPRILVAGDVLGRLPALLKRVVAVNKSNGPFVALFCVGQFFPNDLSDLDVIQKFLTGLEPIPLPTYFIGNYGEGAGLLLSASKTKAAQVGLTMEGIPVCHNLIWLIGSGILNLHGLRIAYLGGKYVADLYHDARAASAAGAIHEDDVDALRAFAEDKAVTDFFLSNEWPKGVAAGADKSNISSDVAAVEGLDLIAELAAELKPRYHFAGSEDVFYAREPYLNPEVKHCTRFIGLGAVGNDKKQKFIHALSPTPAFAMPALDLAVRPPNVTFSPYEIARVQNKRAASNDPGFKNGVGQDEPHGVKHPAEPDGQYWRYDVSQAKRPRRDNSDRVCVEFVTRGSCSREGSCRFKHDLGDGTPIPKGSCFDFVTKGNCERGSDCRYRHSFEDPERRESLPPGVCFDFFKAGKCERGSDCRFSHSLDNPAQSRPVGPCWFCLSSADVSTHLVVSVGDHCYCAIAKGPVVPGHVLLLPIEHYPSILSLPSDVTREMEKYLDAIRKCQREQGNSVVIFERFIQLRSATHAHVQIIPIPDEKGQFAYNAFQTAAKQAGFEFHDLSSGTTPPSVGSYLEAREELSQLVHEQNYFFVELPDKRRLMHSLSTGPKISLQFGREVVATLLNMPERGDWKACVTDHEDEVKLAEEFKRQFSDFDPML